MTEVAQKKVVTAKQLAKITRYAFKKVRAGDYIHDRTHIIRTMRLADRLAEGEGANKEICQVAALLHDIGMSVRVEGHEERGANMARILLRSMNFPKDWIERVCQTIRCHSNNIRPSTIEDKIIYDADKLQVVGPVGFGRLIHELLVSRRMPITRAMRESRKIQMIRFKRLRTKTAKILARQGQSIMERYYVLYKKWDDVHL